MSRSPTTIRCRGRRAAASPRSAVRTRGFTLLELLIAVSLLSVLAVLSWRGMESVLRGRDAIVERSDDLRSLTIAMSQMEEDLRRTWPVRLLDLPVPAVGFLADDDRIPPALALLRETSGEGPSQVQQVVWRLRQGVFERGFRAWVLPRPDSPPPDLPFTWQSVVSGVEAVEFRGWTGGRGWQPAQALRARPTAQAVVQPAAPQTGSPRVSGGDGQAGAAAEAVPPQNLAPLVTGIQMVLVRRGERIVRVFSVVD